MPAERSRAQDHAAIQRAPVAADGAMARPQESALPPAADLGPVHRRVDGLEGREGRDGRDGGRDDDVDDSHDEGPPSIFTTLSPSFAVVPYTVPAPIATPRSARLLPWLALAFGLAALYLPTLIDLYLNFWRVDSNSHGPVVIGMATWLLVHKARRLLAADADAAPLHAPRADGLPWAAAWLALGLLAYMIGRSQGLLPLEMGSVVPVLAGLVTLTLGARAARRLWFPIAFFLFTIPLPGSLTDALTQPLKLGVSWAAEQVLYGAGYPIARAGVVLHIGPFQLLVADACAGLHSLFTLEALGLFYLNVVRHESVLRNLVLAALIVPISFCANTLRVVVLALVTYHFGDAAGQGFLHDFSGIVLFLSALLLIIGVDTLLRRLGRPWTVQAGRPGACA
jgi:exosortase B